MRNRLHIIIPFYNAEATLGRTIASLERISRDHRGLVKVIAVDDGSTDAGPEMVEPAIAKVEGIEHELIRKTNGGSGSARNRALTTFTEGWTLFLDADDELITDPFPLIEQNFGKSALLFAVEYFRNGRFLKRGRVVFPRPGRLATLFSALNPFHPLSIIFRRELADRFFAEELTYLEDWHFWAVNPAIFADCAAYPQVVLGRVHVGPGNKSADLYNNGRFRIEVAEKIGVFWGERLGERERNNLRMQQEIGRIQMGGRGHLGPLARFPISLSLYGKYIIYAFLYPLYRRFQPYREK
jgi:glycosyltransferase involved in cell wall biosynthesis